jgi:hypothetical protein
MVMAFVHLPSFLAHLFKLKKALKLCEDIV